MVAAIIGVMLTLTALAWRSDPARTLEAEAQRLAGTLELAQARAQIGGARLAFSAAADAYQFWQRDDAGLWREIGADSGLARRTLAPGIRVSGHTLAGTAVALGERIAIAVADDPALAIRLQGQGASALVASGTYAGEMQVQLVRSER